jgi:hypothetical protein
MGAWSGSGQGASLSGEVSSSSTASSWRRCGGGIRTNDGIGVRGIEDELFELGAGAIEDGG